MISSIVLTGCYNIGVNSNNKIKVGDQLLSVTNEIPFVRYRFNNYDEQEIEYIRQMKQKFARSTHLAEINLDANTANAINKLNEIGNIAKFVYVTINEENVQLSSMRTYELALATQLLPVNIYIDRFMIKDKSTTLDTVCAKKLIKQLSDVCAVQECDFGVCSSPLSFGDLACLTAIRARELMTKYSEVADVALPSANHQCMNCCGCIRYMVVSEDLAAPADVKKGTTAKPKAEKAESTEKKKAPEKQKPTLIPGRFSL